MGRTNGLSISDDMRPFSFPFVMAPKEDPVKTRHGH